MPAAQREAFDLFVVARTVAMLGWCASRRDHARIHARLPLQAKSVLQRGEAYRRGVPQTEVAYPRSAT